MAAANGAAVLCIGILVVIFLYVFLKYSVVLMKILSPKRATACLAKIYSWYKKTILSRRIPALFDEYYRRLVRTGVRWHVVGICSAFLSVLGFHIWIQANMFKVRAR